MLFVCVKNAGKSQMAAGLMCKIAGDAVHVYSAGTKPGTAANTLSAEVLGEVGVDITDQAPIPMDPRIVQDVDVVVTLGREAHIEPVPEPSWNIDEPSERGIDGSNACGWSAMTSQAASPICLTACKRGRPSPGAACTAATAQRGPRR